MQELVITKPGCKEFAHELENYLHLCAYGIETGVVVRNPSFFAHHRFFTLVARESRMTRLFSRLATCTRAIPLLRVAHALYARYIFRSCATCCVTAWRAPTFLPLSETLLKKVATGEQVYSYGWLFRHTKGLAPYRSQLLEAFKPARQVQDTIDQVIAPVARTHTLIGVQVRQRPYTGFADGTYLVHLSRVRTIIEEYLDMRRLDKKDVALVIVSDEGVPAELFADYTTFVSPEPEPTNLFLLAHCSVVIGENGSYANLAAWFGDVPHIVTSESSIDWDHYKDKRRYFANDYLTLVR